MLLRKQVSVRNGEKKLVDKRESRKYCLTMNVQRIVCCLRLTSDLKECIKQQRTKSADFIDMLYAVSHIAEEFHWTE